MTSFNAIVLCLCSGMAVLGQSPELKQETVKYILSLQQEDGGFRASLPSVAKRNMRSSLRATTAAIRALRYMHETPKDWDKIKQFVESCYDQKSGGYADFPCGPPDLFSTAVGLMALVELKLDKSAHARTAVTFLVNNAQLFEDIRIAAAGLESIQSFPKETVEAWLALVAKLRNEDGSYGRPAGDVRMTGSALALLWRIGGRLDDAPRLRTLAIILDGQNLDGGFGKAKAKTSDLDSCYRVVRALILLKEKPKKKHEMLDFIKKCRNSDGGYGLAPGQESSIGATYYAAILNHWLK